jgi:hypothetical protein
MRLLLLLFDAVAIVTTAATAAISHTLHYNHYCCSCNTLQLSPQPLVLPLFSIIPITTTVVSAMSSRCRFECYYCYYLLMPPLQLLLLPLLLAVNVSITSLTSVAQ